MNLTNINNLIWPHLVIKKRLFLASPERLSDLVRGSQKEWVVLDEIQKVPLLLDVVHTLIEEKTGIKFVLTGSASKKWLVLRKKSIHCDLIVH